MALPSRRDKEILPRKGEEESPSLSDDSSSDESSSEEESGDRSSTSDSDSSSDESSDTDSDEDQIAEDKAALKREKEKRSLPNTNRLKPKRRPIASSSFYKVLDKRGDTNNCKEAKALWPVPGGTALPETIIVDSSPRSERSNTAGIKQKSVVTQEIGETQAKSPMESPSRAQEDSQSKPDARSNESSTGDKEEAMSPAPSNLRIADGAKRASIFRKQKSRTDDTRKPKQQASPVTIKGIKPTSSVPSPRAGKSKSSTNIDDQKMVGVAMDICHGPENDKMSIDVDHVPESHYAGKSAVRTAALKPKVSSTCEVPEAKGTKPEAGVIVTKTTEKPTDRQPGKEHPPKEALVRTITPDDGSKEAKTTEKPADGQPGKEAPSKEAQSKKIATDCESEEIEMTEKSAERKPDKEDPPKHVQVKKMTTDSKSEETVMTEKLVERKPSKEAPSKRVQVKKTTTGGGAKETNMTEKPAERKLSTEVPSSEGEDRRTTTDVRSTGNRTAEKRMQRQTSKNAARNGVEHVETTANSRFNETKTIEKPAEGPPAIKAPRNEAEFKKTTTDDGSKETRSTEKPVSRETSTNALCIGVDGKEDSADHGETKTNSFEKPSEPSAQVAVQGIDHKKAASEGGSKESKTTEKAAEAPPNIETAARQGDSKEKEIGRKDELMAAAAKIVINDEDFHFRYDKDGYKGNEDRRILSRASAEFRKTITRGRIAARQEAYDAWKNEQVRIALSGKRGLRGAEQTIKKKKRNMIVTVSTEQLVRNWRKRSACSSEASRIDGTRSPVCRSFDGEGGEKTKTEKKAKKSKTVKLRIPRKCVGAGKGTGLRSACLPVQMRAYSNQQERSAGPGLGLRRSEAAAGPRRDPPLGHDTVRYGELVSVDRYNQTSGTLLLLRKRGLASLSQQAIFGRFVVGFFVRLRTGEAEERGESGYALCRICRVLRGAEAYEVEAGSGVRTNWMVEVEAGGWRTRSRLCSVSGEVPTWEEWERYVRTERRVGRREVEALWEKARDLVERGRFVATAEERRVHGVEMQRIYPAPPPVWGAEDRWIGSRNSRGREYDRGRGRRRGRGRWEGEREVKRRRRY